MSGDRIFLQLRHFAGPPVVNPGAAKVAQCDDEGNLLVAGTFSPGPPTPVAAPDTATSEFDTVTDVLVAEPCRLYQVRASNENAWGLWLLIINLATLPGDDEEGVWSIFVPAASSVAEVFTAPLGMTAGVAYAWSLRPKHVYFPPVFTGSAVSVATFT